MKIVYIAGPYHGNNPSEHLVWERIMLARDLSKQAWLQGHMPIVPHLNSMLMGGLVPAKQFVEGDLELIHRAVDELWLLPGYSESPGTQQEIATAIVKGIPILEWEKRDGEWITIATH